jgi:hypothetical protein
MIRLEVFIPKFGRGDLDKTAPKRDLHYFIINCISKNGEWMMDAQQPSSEGMKFKEAFAQLVEKNQGKLIN